MDPDTLRARARADALAALQAEGHPLVLPTVWDVWSARTAVAAGFAALTIGSHPLADSRGASDHEGQTFTEVLDAVRPIIAAVDVPVSVDLEAGYGQDPADLVAGLLDVGGVGLNIEDTVHSEGGRVRSTEEHAELRPRRAHPDRRRATPGSGSSASRGLGRLVASVRVHRRDPCRSHEAEVLRSRWCSGPPARPCTESVPAPIDGVFS